MTDFTCITEELRKIGHRSSDEVDLGNAALILARMARPDTEINP